MADEQLSERAELDVPGETRRQTLVFGIWLACLAVAVAGTVARRPTSSRLDRPVPEEHMSAYNRERWLLGGVVGVVVPGLLTWWVTHRRRRGGPHALGIVVDVTEDGELRVWGRGYGQRISLHGAQVSERLVDMYSGRLGAWRQRRLIIRAARPIAGMPPELSLGTPALDADESLELPLVGGEGDCIELRRDAYLRVLEIARRVAAPSQRHAPDA